MDKNATIQELATQLETLAEENKELKDPLYLLMWLRHGNLNVSVTAKSIKESYKWRDEMAVNKGLEELEPPADFKLSMDEKTKDGCLAVYIDFGGMDVRKALQKFGVDHLHKVFIYQFARAEKIILENNRKLVESTEDVSVLKTKFKPCIIFVNVEGMALMQVTSFQVIKLSLDAVTSLVKYFPDLSPQVTFIKASKIFKVMFNLLEPIFRGKVKMSMHEVGNEKWLQNLGDQLELSQIPESFGGTKIVPLDHIAWSAKQNSKRTQA